MDPNSSARLLPGLVEPKPPFTVAAEVAPGSVLKPFAAELVLACP